MVHSQPIFDTTLEYWPETRRVTALCVPSSPLPLPVLRPISVHAYLRACVCVPARVPRPAPISKIATLPPPMKPAYIIEPALRSSLMKLLRKQDRLGTNLRDEKVPFPLSVYLSRHALSSFFSLLSFLLFSFLLFLPINKAGPVLSFEFTRRGIRGNRERGKGDDLSSQRGTTS